MPKRLTRITLLNNTSFDLSLVSGGDQLCHGQWTKGWQPPPAQIKAMNSASWQSESHGFLTGTEGWVKYEIPANTITQTPPELVFIHWDNPYIWSNGTTPCEQQVSMNDVKPSCKSNKGAWDNGSFGGQPVTTNPAHELFCVGFQNNGQGWDWGTGPVGQVTTVVVAWPALLILGLVDAEQDVHIEIILGLRTADSVGQTIFNCWDGRKGLRTLANIANEPSMRRLFAM